MNIINETPAQDQGKILKIAIIAVGGQGGGVLTNWIESMARQQGYHCQATSVAGVAQRTGATIYYIEMAPKAAAIPVFSLAPSEGDLDVVIAAELMEAGRAIQRGFVTPNKTTFVASTHRTLAVSEKMVPGDGIVDGSDVIAAAEIAAKRLVMFDLDAMAVQNGSVISASLFGALAGTKCLPFPCAAFEASIKAGGKGVVASLRAFSAAYEAVDDEKLRSIEATETPTDSAPNGKPKLIKAWENLNRQISAWPAAVQSMARTGVQKVVDFQDVAYGQIYLDRVQQALSSDTKSQEYVFSVEFAKYLANAMAYDDIIKVADLKTRGQRFARIRSEMRVQNGTDLHLTEYFHPRAEEVIGLLPAKMGKRVSASQKWQKRLGKWFGKGRRLRTDRLLSFMMLYVIGGLRWYRPKTLRHTDEIAQLETWISKAHEILPKDYDLAVEIIRCQRLIKGYSFTHERSLGKYSRVLAALDDLNGRPDAADWLRRLREAALLDEKGDALDGALQTIKSFTQPAGQAFSADHAAQV